VYEEGEDVSEKNLFGYEEEKPIEKKIKKKRAEPKSKCVVCGKGLSDPRSVDAGYGPVCMHNHYAIGQENYVGDLFMFDEKFQRRVASFVIDAWDERTILITDLDDDEDKPSVTNSIDEILDRLGVDKHEKRVVCLGSDKMYAMYNGVWKFLGWTEEEARLALRID